MTNQTRVKKITMKRKELANIIKEEMFYISNLFDVLDIANLNRGRRNTGEEDEDSEGMEILDIPEKKLFKSQGSKKGTAQSSSKKSFPQTIDGLEKELMELKGTTMTYQKKLRKKGLQTRLVKKKRKEELKQQKAALKQGIKGNTSVNGITKQIKPVFNSDGNVVSNKFDFADNESRKESKRKVGVISAETNVSREGKGFKNDIQAMKKTQKLPLNDYSGVGSAATLETGTGQQMSTATLKRSEHLMNNSTNKVNVDVKIENIKKENIVENKSAQIHGPIFNKDNKMVFSKVFLPENGRVQKKKAKKKPKMILEKIKENSKKILELEKEDKEKAISLKEKQKWSAALKRASGEKVKDDPELLKKSIMKERNKKMQSQKKWQARIDRVQKEKDDRQKKRSDNIQARKNEKKKRKMKRAVKKGSYVQV